MKKTITLIITILFVGYSNAQAQTIESNKSNTGANQTLNTTSNCPTPGFAITQPTCSVPTGTITFVFPMSFNYPIPTDLFISEVTDEDIGGLSYIEIFNGTGVTKNLANYKLKVYSNGSTTASCDLALTGSLQSGAVFIVSMGSSTNAGGVIPNMVFPACGGVNNNDAITLNSSTNTLIDVWGRTDGVTFTPAGAPGYTYRRLATAVHPKTTWDPADWTALDPQDYTNVGTYDYQSHNYQYSIDGMNYQNIPNFQGLTPGNYQLYVKDLSVACVSIPIQVTINAVPNTVPVFDPIAPICAGSTAPILPNVSSNGISGSWSPAIDNTTTTTYFFTPDSGQCAATATLTIDVNQAPVISGLVNMLVCDADSNPNDGIAIFNLDYESAIILSQQQLPASNYTVTYYTTQADANAGIGTIVTPTSYVASNGQTIWVRVENIATGCYAIGSFQLVVYPTQNPILVSNNTLNTVFVDANNTVVQPLLLDSQLTGNYSYIWQEDGITIPNATNSTYLVDTASLNGVSRVFTVFVTDNIYGCSSSATITVVQSSGVPSPTGATSQTFNPGDTLATLTVVGQNILWYSSALNRNVTAAPLPSNTALVNGTIYYASQTIGGVESAARLPVTATSALGLITIKNSLITIYPNPAQTFLNLQVANNLTLDKIIITDLNGKTIKVQTQKSNTINIENLAQGTYILEAYSGEGKYSSKFVKE